MQVSSSKMLTPCGAWLLEKRGWVMYTTQGSARFILFCKHSGLYPTCCNTYAIIPMENQGSEETFEFDCCVRGYHFTEKHWKDIAIGEGLTVCLEKNLKYNPSAMAVYPEHGPGNERMNVGHTPIELSSTASLLRQTGMEGIFQLKWNRKTIEQAIWNKVA